jgi:predicted membrane metal-binding protein
MEPILTVALLIVYLFCDLCGINPPIFVLVIYGCITALFGVLMLRVLSAIWTALLVCYGGYLAYKAWELEWSNA